MLLELSMQEMHFFQNKSETDGVIYCLTSPDPECWLSPFPNSLRGSSIASQGILY